MTPLAKAGFAVRLFSLAWTAMLIGLMATGTLSSARIGAMTWEPSHDIWSAAIAISQINFGLSKIFCLKGATVTVAAFVFVIGVFPIGQRFVERQLTKRTDQLAVEKTELRELLKGGSGFRMAAEKKLYA